MSSTDFLKILAVLAACYPRFNLTKETIEAYSIFLQDIPLLELEIAMRECATRYDFFPSVHEIRKVVVDLRRRASKIPTAYEAWDDLLNAGNGVIKRIVEDPAGDYIEKMDYQWLHPLVKRVAEMLGYPQTFPGDNPPADRAHYFKAYDQAVSEMSQNEMMLPEVRQAIESKTPQLGKIKMLADKMEIG